MGNKKYSLPQRLGGLDTFVEVTVENGIANLQVVINRGREELPPLNSEEVSASAFGLENESIPLKPVSPPGPLLELDMAGGSTAYAVFQANAAFENLVRVEIGLGTEKSMFLLDQKQPGGDISEERK